MAGTLVSVGVPFLQYILPRVPALVKEVDLLWGQKNGTSKKKTLLDWVTGIGSALATAGVTQPAPAADVLSGFLEAVVQDVKVKGEMPTEQPAKPAASTTTPVVAPAVSSSVLPNGVSDILNGVSKLLQTLSK